MTGADQAFWGDYFTVTMCVTHFQQRVIRLQILLKNLKILRS